MPYITPEAQEEVRIFQQSGYKASTVGELTYAFSDTIDDYLGGKEEINFVAFAEVLGALEATKLEFYRRIVAPYEEKKLKENGDVFISFDCD